jgi:hypothetical protein
MARSVADGMLGTEFPTRDAPLQPEIVTRTSFYRLSQSHLWFHQSRNITAISFSTLGNAAI